MRKIFTGNTLKFKSTNEGANLRLHPKCGTQITNLTPNEKERYKPPPSKSFSTRSRQSVMINNLKLGIEFKNRQYNNLISINENISQMSPYAECPKDSKGCAWKLYLDVISNLTSERYSNFPLFGYGIDPPIRVHLVRYGKPLVFEFSVSTLLQKLNFQAVLNCGLSNKTPSKHIIESCSREILEEMLSISSEKDRADELLDEYLHGFSIKKEAISNNNVPDVIPVRVPFVQRLINTILSPFYQKAAVNI